MGDNGILPQSSQFFMVQSVLTCIDLFLLQIELECRVFRNFPLNRKTCVHQGSAGIGFVSAVDGVHSIWFQALCMDIIDIPVSEAAVVVIALSKPAVVHDQQVKILSIQKIQAD